MRILIVSESFFPKVDGVTRTVAKLLEHLEQGQHQVMLFCPDSGQTEYASAELVGTTGIPFLPYPELKLNLWRPTFTKKLTQFHPQVIHLVDPVWLGAAALAVCKLFSSQLQSIPLVASYHTNLATYCTHFGWGIFSPLMWRWNQFCHSFCRYTVCPSPSTRDMLVSHGFNNVRLWPRGVNPHRFSRQHRSLSLRTQWLKTSVDKTILLYVGRISYEKNLQLVMETYKLMDHSLCHLVVVGDGPALTTVQQQSATIPVTFTGYLYGNDLATAFASADIFTFPSTTETFGQVVLEAMASGLPVSGLMAEGVRDLVQHEYTGLLLDTTTMDFTEQCQQYKQHWMFLIQHVDARITMGENAAKVAASYTWTHAMEQMVQVYKDAINESVHHHHDNNNNNNDMCTVHDI
ncbi:glycosyl transferase group 1 [Halteromyces radiatus]|uniref:glycosyl transferase group 1 n=1 Tax=Halteromyces radiatus TaxID=101107 RepID=UPI00221F6957|nr:glycosyl transferase group 1 [Halteromyces radiatus]KAI8099579.1 glycosyl transferase group 1 [Halteromyces radiatus]